MTTPRRRLLLILPYSFPETSPLYVRPTDSSPESLMMNFADYAHLLADVDWEVHPGPVGPMHDCFAETREEFARVGLARLPIVREACERGGYDAIVLLGGGDPGCVEAREIARQHGIPVTACAHAQMTVATMLGNRFSIVDVSEAHNMRMHDLVVQYRFVEKCASIRDIHTPLPRPSNPTAGNVQAEKQAVQRGDRSEALEAAIVEAVAAIEEDGAETIMLGCSAIYWMQPHLQRRLDTLGWEVPVLEGYRAAIEMAKLLANLGLCASGLAFPGDHPRRWRRRKTV